MLMGAGAGKRLSSFPLSAQSLGSRSERGIELGSQTQGHHRLPPVLDSATIDSAYVRSCLARIPGPSATPPEHTATPARRHDTRDVSTRKIRPNLASFHQATRSEESGRIGSPG